MEVLLVAMLAGAIVAFVVYIRRLTTIRRAIREVRNELETVKCQKPNK